MKGDIMLKLKCFNMIINEINNFYNEDNGLEDSNGNVDEN